MQPSNEGLLEAAQLARGNAYAPYSNYKVGAAILDEKGNVYSGCNVENVSFGATMCAERNAIGGMIAGGGNEIARLTVVTADGGAPCGLCLQCLREFGKDFEIELYADEELIKTVRLSEMLPITFTSGLVSRT